MKTVKEKKMWKMGCWLIFISMGFQLAQSQPNFGITGFATENNGTIGGFGGDTVTATTYNELKTYAESSLKYVILVKDTITNGAGGGKISVRSDKSIIGIGNTAFLKGVGLEISSNNNIIIQNLKITMVGLTTPTNTNDGDCISIFGSSKNIWIDHCEMFSENPDVQTDINKYDGLIDIKNQSGFITISWCYFHNHHKGFLVGSSDTDLYEDRKITYHHNYFNKVKLRLPLYRGSTGHFYNNYIVGAKDATEIRIGTCVRVERNYYEALHYSIYTPNDSRGNTQRINNIEVERDSRAYPPNCTADIPYDYSNFLIYNTEDVKTIVPKYAGVGVIGEVVGNPPNVAISSPANHDVFFENTDITLSADGTDENGEIVSVEFFRGNTSLGKDTEAPFSISYNVGDSGSYEIYAVATDNEGGTSPSSSVTFNVEPTPVSIHDKDMGLPLDVSVYPIPAINSLTLEFNQELQETIEVVLYDLTGKIMKSVTIKGIKYRLNMAGISEGLYMVKISGKNLNKVLLVSKL